MRLEVDLKKRDSDVIFDRSMEYRYWLRRSLEPFSNLKSACLFIMLNPSKADAYRNDNTVSRCMKFATLWGFHQLWVCNLFGLRSPYPGDIYESDDPVGDDNDFYIEMAIKQADRVVVAWGNHGGFQGRSDRVLNMIKYHSVNAMTFGLTQSKFPMHPLARGKNWIPYETELRKYEDLLAA